MRLVVNSKSGTIHKGLPNFPCVQTEPRAACNYWAADRWYRPHRLCHICFTEEEREKLAKMEETKGRKSNAGRSCRDSAAS